MKVEIKTLSPIHIGNGEKYKELSYYKEGSKIFILDFDKVKRNLLSNERNSRFFSDFILKLKQQSFQKTQRKHFWEEFFSDYLREKPDKLKDYALYSVECFSKKSRDIDCFIKQNNSVYIPGTEIKGAIRTALIYHLLSRHWNWFKEELNGILEKFVTNSLDIKNLRRAVVSLEKEMQARVLIASQKAYDSRTDLLRFLIIGDSNLKDPKDCLFVSDLEIIGSSRNISFSQEFCKKGESFFCDIKVDYKQFSLNKLGFSDEHKGIISDIKNIFNICYEFTKRLIEEEKKYDEYPDSVKRSLEFIEKENKPDSPVIRIGKNQGYFGLTVGLLIKDKNQNLFDKVVRPATKGRTYQNNFPKTRRVVVLDSQQKDTCGWVKLTLKDSI
ncbi:MAG: type III-A CRISPR-associated RAMP protein Csm5 [bacterium]|nr:type III-A CRISPR-associated RAMP protein Csm5 [bacterium]MDW8087701.1 type III-A CRISPR-associated RAMP protein Csm5 [Candidatus Calescibacterium sp.]